MINRKAQSFMPDFLASIALFGVVISIFLFAWNGVVSNQGDFSRGDTLRQEAYYTTTFLVSTPGYPEDWNESNVEIPGFASSDNLIQKNKLETFNNISYSQQKLLLQAPEFYLEFSNSSGIYQLSGENLSYGRDPENASTATVITRNVLLNLSTGTENAEMMYVAWE